MGTLSIQWQVLYIVAIIIATLLMLLLLLHTVRLRHLSGARSFVIFMLVAILWAVNVGIMALAPPSAGYVWLKLKYGWIALAPVALLCFVLDYTNYDRWLQKRVIAALLLIPALTQLVVWTNGQHGLMIREIQFAQLGMLTYIPALTFGPYYWVHVGYGYMLSLLSIVLVVITRLRSSYLYRWQGFFWVAAMIAPLVANVLLIAGITPRAIDPMPFALLLTGLLLWWSVFRYHLLDLAPVARNIFVDLMPEGMVAIDTQGRIIDINPAMVDLIGVQANRVIGLPIREVLKPWQDLVEGFRAETNLQTEIAIGHRQFDLLIRPLTNHQGELRGRLIVLHDITQRKAMATEREKLIETLQEALSQVKRLSGLLPICASCKKIRDDSGYWHDVAVYVRDHSEAEFSHSICPECRHSLYEGYAKKRKEQQ